MCFEMMIYIKIYLYKIVISQLFFNLIAVNLIPFIKNIS